MTDDSNPANTDIPWSLLTYYATSSGTESEREEAERWVASHPEHQALVEQFLESCHRPSMRLNRAPLDMAAVEQQIFARISHGNQKPPRKGEHVQEAVRRWVSLYNLAWVIPVFVIVAMVGLRYTDKNPATPSHTPAVRTYSTNSGQRASIDLSDGSRVILGPQTTLRIAASNAETNAEVTGEALFNVNHAAKRPFTVKAHGVTTRVLGTEFVVRAYDASHIRVAVRDGRVSVQSPLVTSANTAIVSAGEAASVSQNASPVIASIDDLATDFGWANGELVLRDVTLGESLTRLSRWYGLEFRVADPSLLNERVNVVFPAEFKEAKVEALALVIKARVTRSGRTFTFSRIK